jgi:hypothetical protein
LPNSGADAVTNAVANAVTDAFADAAANADAHNHHDGAHQRARSDAVDLARHVGDWQHGGRWQHNDCANDTIHDCNRIVSGCNHWAHNDDACNHHVKSRRHHDS